MVSRAHGPELDTRALLVNAARDALVKEGVAGVSMRRVAAACGVSAPAIYRHFADKDELVCAAALQGFAQFGQYLLDALAGRTPIERFRRMLQRYLDFAREHPRDYQVMFMTPCEELGWHKLDETATREARGTFQMLVDRVAECQQAGAFRDGDPEALAVFAWSALHGLASLTLTGNLDAEPGLQAAMGALQLESIELALARGTGTGAAR